MLREGKENSRLVIPGNPENHIKSKAEFKILFIFMPWPAIRKTANNDSISRPNSRPERNGNGTGRDGKLENARKPMNPPLLGKSKILRAYVIEANKFLNLQFESFSFALQRFYHLGVGWVKIQDRLDSQSSVPEMFCVERKNQCWRNCEKVFGERGLLGREEGHCASRQLLPRLVIGILAPIKERKVI